MSSNLLNRPRTTSDAASIVARKFRQQEASPSQYSRKESQKRTATLLSPRIVDQVRNPMNTFDNSFNFLRLLHPKETTVIGLESVNRFLMEIASKRLIKQQPQNHQ